MHLFIMTDISLLPQQVTPLVIMSFVSRWSTPLSASRTQTSKAGRLFVAKMMRYPLTSCLTPIPRPNLHERI